MKKIFSLHLSLVVVFIFSANAQSNPDWEYWTSNRLEIKRGMSEEFEKAASLKTKKFNTTPETAISTYKVMTGPDQGKYERIQGYKDISWFNGTNGNKGVKYWMKNVNEFVNQNDGRIIWWRIKNLSHNWNPESKPTKYFHRIVRIVKPGKLGDFWRFANRITEVYKKHNFTGIQACFKVVSGGNENMMVFVDAFNDFTDQGKFPDTDKSLKELYNEMYNGSYDRDLEIYNDALEMWGRQKELLSLVPEATTGM